MLVTEQNPHTNQAQHMRAYLTPALQLMTNLFQIHEQIKMKYF